MPSLRVVKVTTGKMVNGRFIPAKANPKRKCNSAKSRGLKYKKARLKEMIREASKKKNARRRKR